MSSISGRMPPVAVEYDGAKGQRVTKQFADAYAARRFYAAKHRAGKNPRVRKASGR